MAAIGRPRPRHPARSRQTARNRCPKQRRRGPASLSADRLLSRDTSLSKLSTDFAGECLKHVFPGTHMRLAVAVASFGLNHSWPAVQQSARDSLEAPVFRNWLVGLSP
jgi:hypothetical protein